MKTLTALLILGLFSNTASASFYQRICSSADGYTKKADGHLAFHTTLTNIDYENGERIETPITLDYDSFKIETLSSKKLISENSSNCDKKYGSGFANWRNVTFETIEITKNDGSLFPKGVVGVSQDRTKVTADLLCEEDGNSQVFCEKQ